MALIAAQPATARASVLLGFAESLPAPEAAWSVLEAGFDVTAFTRRGRRPPLRRSRSVRIAEVAAPEQDAAATEADLRRLASAIRPDVVLPIDDASVHLCARALHGVTRIAGPVEDRMRFALDKRLQLEAAREAGFAVPPTRVLAAAEQALDGTDLPAVLKPALAVLESDGALANGRSFVCANRAELERAVRALPPQQPVLAQPLLRGVGEGIFGMATSRGVRAWSAHRRVRMMEPEGSGSSACASIPLDPGLSEPAERMLAAAGWRGLFMVEMLRDRDGKAWFMELNGRSWGSLALARRQGLEYPAWAVEQALDPDFEPPAVALDGRQVICRHLGREILHVLFVLRGPRSVASTDRPSRLRSIAQVCHVSPSDRWYNARPGDRAVFVDDAVRTVLETIRRG